MIPIRKIIEETCNTLGLPELNPKIVVQWNDRLTRTAGKAWPNKNLIELSPVLLARTSEADQKNTVVHEVCHLAAPILYNRKVAWHGKEWQSLMLRCGELPERCHSIPRDDLKRNVKRWEALCACALPHLISTTVKNRIQKGNYYFCKKCKERLNLTGFYFDNE